MMHFILVQDSYWNKKGIFGYMPMVVLFIVFVGCRRDALDHISFSVYFVKERCVVPASTHLSTEWACTLEEDITHGWV